MHWCQKPSERIRNSKVCASIFPLASIINNPPWIEAERETGWPEPKRGLPMWLTFCFSAVIQIKSSAGRSIREFPLQDAFCTTIGSIFYCSNIVRKYGDIAVEPVPSYRCWRRKSSKCFRRWWIWTVFSAGVECIFQASSVQTIKVKGSAK